jgi:hypothetical protein
VQANGRLDTEVCCLDLAFGRLFLICHRLLNDFMLSQVKGNVNATNFEKKSTGQT